MARVCAVCGAKFEPKRGNQAYCSHRCARNAVARRDRNRSVREVEHALAVSRPVPTAQLMKAPCKPVNTSDVRWRIELRRRANSRHYAEFGEVLRR